MLNVATTRLILTHAETNGMLAAGGVVKGFGEFVAGDKIVVGLIIFVIIVVIQFVVITKGPRASAKWRPALPWMECRAARWRSTPI